MHSFFLSKDAESSLGDFGIRKYDDLVGRFFQIDPLWEKYYGWTPYHYSANNPVSFLDPSGLTVTKIIINVHKAEATILSDVNPTRKVPVAVGSYRTPSPSPGQNYKVRKVAWGPVSAKWANANESWQTNKDNPFGPAILILETEDGEKSDRHLHGTNGTIECGVDCIGGEDSEGRKFTHGCVRFTNEEIIRIMEEGVEEEMPVEFEGSEESEGNENEGN